jgi:hypothetical protein
MRPLKIRINVDVDPRLIALSLTVLSLSQIAWAAAFSDVFVQTLWPSTLVRQTGLLCLCCAALVAAAVYLDRTRVVPSRAFLSAMIGVAIIGLYGILPACAVVLFLLASLALGTHLQPSPWRGPPGILTNVLLGAAVLALINTLMAPLPINDWVVHAVFMFIPIVALSFRGNARQAFIQSSYSAIEYVRVYEQQGLISIFLKLWATFLAFWFLILGALPEMYHDGLAVHLYVASYMQAHGKWSFDPDLYAFAFIPAAITHLYGHFFILAGEQGARLFNVTLLLLTCVGIVSLARTCATKNAALAAALLFASAPLASIETASLFVENGLALWITGSVYILVKHWDDAKAGALPLLALLAAACATKLHGALGACVIGLAFLWRVLVDGGPQSLVKVAPAVLIFAALGVSPYAFSYWVTGNPLFPYFNDIFASGYFEKLRMVDARWNASPWPNPLYALSVRSSVFLESWNGAGGFAWMIFLPAATLLPFMTLRRVPLICLTLGFALTAVMLTQIRYLRYVYPFLPVLCVPIAYLLSERIAGWRRNILVAVVVFAAALNMFKVPSAGWILSAIDFRGVIDASVVNQMERAFVPHRLANREINRLGGKDARVLYVGGPFAALLQGTAIYSNWYNSVFRREAASVVDQASAESYIDLLRVDYIVHDGNVAGPFAAIMLSAVSSNRQPMMRVGRLTVWKWR